MGVLRTATFGELFATVFLVNAVFHVLLALFGVLAAFGSPGSFNANGQPVESPAGALGVLVFGLVVFTILNAAASALGSGLWVLLRKLVWKAN